MDGNDVNMGDAVPDTKINGEAAPGTDLTDPQPPPQVLNQASTTEHLSTIQPGVPAPAISALSATAAPRTSSVPPAPAVVRPEKPALHGGHTRRYLNQNVTPHLLEGMKYLAMNEPEKPLAWLADFLKERSKQIEG